MTKLFIRPRRLHRYRSDAVIGTHVSTKTMLTDLAVRIPQQLAFAALIWPGPGADCAGVDIQGEQIGATAVDLVAEQLRRHEQGLNSWCRTTLIDGIWREGGGLGTRSRGS